MKDKAHKGSSRSTQKQQGRGRKKKEKEAFADGVDIDSEGGALPPSWRNRGIPWAGQR